MAGTAVRLIRPRGQGNPTGLNRPVQRHRLLAAGSVVVGLTIGPLSACRTADSASNSQSPAPEAPAAESTIGPAVPARSQADGADTASGEPGTTDAERNRFVADPSTGDSETLTHVRSSNQSGSYQIVLTTPTGTKPITDDPDHDYRSPRVSPDGSLVAAVRRPKDDAGGHLGSSLVTIRLDGSGMIERVGPERFGTIGPAGWSPDGRTLVFAASEDDGVHRLWFADLVDPWPGEEQAGGLGARLRPGPNRDAPAFDPAFGPDGQSLVFAGFPASSDDVAGSLEIFTVDLDGSGEKRLTDDGIDDRQPAWSPDGSAIVFSSATEPDHRLVGQWALRIVDPDRATADPDPVVVLDDEQVNVAPRWALGGHSLVFQRFRWGDAGYWTASLDLASGRITQLTSPQDHDAVEPDPVTRFLVSS